jgi:phosphatidylserine/phosphatidylglycerophosphate/cardiolipin synthase-like enzyme
MVRMQGPIADLVQDDFNDSWAGNNRESKIIEVADEPGTFLLTDSGKEEQIVQFALEHIIEAKNRIWLETPYLDMAGIGSALCLAKKNNPKLDIQVIIPGYNNYPIDRLRAEKVCQALREANITAHMYGKSHKRLNHTKMLLIDDVGVFGSSNFNSGSMAGKNAEIAVATKNISMVNQLERWYAEDLMEAI